MSTSSGVLKKLKGPDRESQHGKSKILTTVIAVVSVALFAIVWFVDLDREIVGALVVALVVLLLIGGVHIAIAILLPGILGILVLSSPNALISLLEDQPFTAVAGWQFSVIPFFILMGMALWKSGIAAKAFDAAKYWLAGVPGGLAIGTVATGGALAAASGSTIGIAYALGKSSLPEMLKAKYNPGLAIGAVSFAGILGQIIPPSVILVIYASIVQVSIGQQLMAGVIPGVLLMVSVSVLVIIRVLKNPGIAPAASLQGVTRSTKFKSLAGALPLVVIILAIIGGMLTGVFTATEAGAFGAFAAVIIGLLTLPKVERNAKGMWVFLRDISVGAVQATAAIFLLLIAVYFLTKVLTLSNLAQTLAGYISDMGLNSITLMLLLIPFYLLIGCFLDTLAILLVTVPVLLPTLVALDVDLLWFGVFVVILAEMALITPPLGMLIFIVHRLAQSSGPASQNITLTQAFAGVGWYLLAAVVVLLALVFFPDLVTWLPNSFNIKG